MKQVTELEVRRQAKVNGWFFIQWDNDDMVFSHGYAQVTAIFDYKTGKYDIEIER